MSSASETYATIDLGSNSFHMIVARTEENQVHLIDKLKDMVRLAGGLDEEQRLDEETTARALDCLQRFGQRIKDIPPTNIRAVGTNTLRQAHNSHDFLKQANRALGHRIEIISGREEARLIFLGVAHTIFNESERRLVVDIGGGSTELAIGKGFHAGMTDSLYIGCVSMSHRFFANGNIKAKKMRKAILTARQELEALEAIYQRVGWDNAIGTSGTILTIHNIITSQGWSESGITKEGLEKLRESLVSAGAVSKLKLEGLPAERAPVFPGGVAILSAVFDALDLEVMNVSDGALREGLLHDLIGRLHNRDVRDTTIENITKRYNIDNEQALRVENTVTEFLEQLRQPWQLDTENDLKILRWAARLHEIGLTIAHSQYHKHGAYLLRHSDLPGFSREEQTVLAFLVRCHRRKFDREEIDLLPSESRDNILRLCIILRLSIVLNRGRAYSALPSFTTRVDDNNITLEFPSGWLAEHPLTEADLDTEANYLDAIGITLTCH